MNGEDVLKYGHKTVVDTLQGLDEADWLAPGVCGVWSVKEIMAHLASYEQLLVEILENLVHERPTPLLNRFMETYEQFNDAEVAARQGQTVAETWAEYETAQARTVALLAQVPPEQRRSNGLLAWYGPAYDLEDFLAYTYYGHKREHMAQVAVFKDRLAEARQEQGVSK